MEFYARLKTINVLLIYLCLEKYSLGFSLVFCKYIPNHDAAVLLVLEKFIFFPSEFLFPFCAGSTLV